MLGIMRKYKQSPIIKVVFGVIVLSFIGTIFLVWGKGEGKLTPSSYAVKVDRTTISYEDFQRTYYRLRDIYVQLYGPALTPELEKQLNVKKQALDTLVEGALVRNAARDMGIKVSKDDVQQAIAAMPSFQVNGAFSFNQYVQVLKANRIAPKEFEESQKEELMIKKAQDKIKSRATVTDDEAHELFRKRNDRLALSYVSFSPDDVKGEIKLTDQEITDFLAQNQNDFKTPEKISITYVMVDPLKVGGLEVSEADMQAWYQKNIDRYQGPAGILPLAEVKEKVREDARRFKAGQHAYELAADAVNKNKATGDIGAVARALGARTEETALFTAQQPAPALAGETELIRRAFLLKEGELGGPVETKKGIYLIKLKERKPAEVPPLAQIRAQVEEKARAAKAVDLAKKKAEEAQAKLAKGDSTGLTLRDSGSFAFDAKGSVPTVGASPELMEAAFTLTTAAPAPKEPIRVGARWIAFRLKERTELNAANFAAQKEKIKQEILPRKQDDEYRKWIEELRSKAKIEINPALKDI
ncbi:MULTISPECIES: peptidylprolyl isomerase [Geobacter]|uniref:Periplasmic chaperone PpiD n=2 Tax=Geobacter TaxID=28231 RepID=A0A0C1TLU3_9BACT|nr:MULTISPECIES: peptidylprolyl isomerase [Geobacter]ANA40016.1 peptidylprolyl isomerase [Geobacter anodireducens]KIE41889.1 peptidylprolyl isomerase [Geobacter soli]MBE2889112.1 SurA N-terminal domain-containing protein [Geobacter anodireducens]HMN03635.1 SurA N-terminal domain-containing protein [Geobacter anodireducens]